MHKLKKHLSLKIRIFLFFLGILTLMLCTYIFAISRFITRFTEKQLNADYEAILTETTDTIENLLWNLTLTSEQLLSNETITASLTGYQNTLSPYTKQQHYSVLLDTLNSLTMSNTDIALTYFYDTATEEYIYSSFPVNNMQPDLPIIYQNSSFSFHGPCTSQCTLIGNPVLILNRTEELPNGHLITLSVESGYYSLDNPLQAVERKSAYLVLTNYQNEPIFSTLPDKTNAMELLSRIANGIEHEYHSFNLKSAQGWSVYIIVPSTIYTRDYQIALRDFIICSVLIVLLVSAFAMYFWHSIYHPLQLFDQQLEMFLQDDIPDKQMHSSIPEYDHLLQKMVQLQTQIRDMINQIVMQEKLNTKIQLEKLRAQINPHFLLNTLNTLHWMALMNQQKDIDKITQSLSHLLSYNLDKESYSTNLKNELYALQEYIALQKVRYTFSFILTCDQKVENLDYPCPKFILQPLIENALIHGYRENMTISLTIKVAEQILIELIDTGTGMSEESLNKFRFFVSNISASENAARISEPIHFGIGLQYVIEMLNDFYAGKYEWNIDSSPQTGTTIFMKIPKLKGGGYHAQNTDY